MGVRRLRAGVPPCRPQWMVSKGEPPWGALLAQGMTAEAQEEALTGFLGRLPGSLV